MAQRAAAIPVKGQANPKVTIDDKGNVSGNWVFDNGESLTIEVVKYPPNKTQCKVKVKVVGWEHPKNTKRIPGGTIKVGS